MDKLIGKFLGKLDDDLFITTRGVAYQYDMKTVKYNGEYFDKYQNYKGTKIADKLNECRVTLVSKYTTDPILDIGIGSGEFIENCEDSFGYDINPKAIEWLKDRELFRDDFESFNAFTMWDVIEHIETPEDYFSKMSGHLFCSLPIFEDLDKIRDSKHYRPDEHLYYFTEKGFISWMSLHGFRCVASTNMETKAGREDILSFVFYKDLPTYYENSFYSKWMQ